MALDGATIGKEFRGGRLAIISSKGSATEETSGRPGNAVLRAVEAVSPTAAADSADTEAADSFEDNVHRRRECSRDHFT